MININLQNACNNDNSDDDVFPADGDVDDDASHRHRRCAVDAEVELLLRQELVDTRLSRRRQLRRRQSFDQRKPGNLNESSDTKVQLKLSCFTLLVNREYAAVSCQ